MFQNNQTVRNLCPCAPTPSCDTEYCELSVQTLLKNYREVKLSVFKEIKHRREHNFLEDSQDTDEFHFTLNTYLICLISRVGQGFSKRSPSVRRLVRFPHVKEIGYEDIIKGYS